MVHRLIVTLSLVLLAFSQNQPQTAEKFLYKSSDLLTIQPHSAFTLSMTLTTEADEYLSASMVQSTFQILDTTSTSLPYNLYYFNYESQSGQQCYQSWVSSGHIPNKYQCPDSSQQSLDQFPGCAKFMNCSQQSRNLTLKLTYEMYKESYFIVQNDNSETIQIQTNIYLELSSQNTWFYWGVGLTCLLLISLVIFTGIVFYWILKYKRVKKMFEQFKLTEQAVGSKKE